MTEAEITQYICSSFSDIQIATANGNSFYYHGPEGTIPERTFPFATLVGSDEYDKTSNLDREGVFRLNIGVSKATYNSLLGTIPPAPGDSGIVETGHDFTVLDEIMPHPIYGHMAWICVLNPGKATIETVKSLLKEAYETAVKKSKSTKKN